MHSAHEPRGSTIWPRSTIVIVAALTTAMTLSYCDRYAINLVVEPLKRELVLSDTEVGLLQGFAFSMFFVVGGVPLGFLVDRKRRLSIIAVGIALWSLATCGFGLATSFPGLLACRILVAVGEAALAPAAFSIFADLLPRPRLGLAVGIFSLGVYLGAGTAFLGGAALLSYLGAGGGVDALLPDRLRGWRALFLLAGAAGLPVAAWIATLREPARTGTPLGPGGASFADVSAFARGHLRALAPLFLCAGFTALTSQAYAAWLPSYLVRAFGWSVPRAGSVSGLVIIAGGLTGVLVAGVLGDLLRSRGLARGRLVVMLGSAATALPSAVAAPLVADARSALLLALLTMLSTTVLLTSVAPAIQELVPNRIQGTIIAFYAFVVTFIGLGLGPTTVALVTDHILHDEHRVGVSLAFISLISTTAAVLAAGSSFKPYAASLARRP